MLPQSYPRPFEKGAPIFQSAAGGGIALRRRIVFLRSRYRRAVFFAIVGSLGVHGILGYGLRNESLIVHPEPIVGYRDGIDTKLAPIDPDLAQDRRFARARPPAGALVAIEVETEEEQEAEQAREFAAKRPSTRTTAVDAPPPLAETPGEPLRIELREDWSVDPSSPEAAYSEQFQPLRLVVPEYPALAFARDIQGLVKLEAEVGTSGKVLEVHVLEAEDGSLAMAAAHALLLWEFHPFLDRGTPRPFRIVVPFRFRIEG